MTCFTHWEPFEAEYTYIKTMDLSRRQISSIDLFWQLKESLSLPKGSHIFSTLVHVYWISLYSSISLKATQLHSVRISGLPTTHFIGRTKTITLDVVLMTLPFCPEISGVLQACWNLCVTFLPLVFICCLWLMWMKLWTTWFIITHFTTLCQRAMWVNVRHYFCHARLCRLLGVDRGEPGSRDEMPGWFRIPSGFCRYSEGREAAFANRQTDWLTKRLRGRQGTNQKVLRWIRVWKALR